MSGHTPGPWSVGTTLADDKLAIIHDGDSVMAILTTCPPNMHDARLIAAAPDLLEACQTFAEWLRREDEGLPAGIVRDTPEGEQQWRIWWDENLRICNLAQERARAAIARATGEPA